MLKREPLLLFVLVGLGLYGAWALLAPEPAEVIQIDEASLRAFEQAQEEIYGRPLTDEERDELRQSVIDDELLIREAIKRGMHFADGRVRQRLARIMRGAFTENAPNPSVAQLQAYYQDNIDEFKSPPSITFEQVFFPWGAEDMDASLADAIERLGRGEPATAFQSGLNPNTPPRVPRADRQRLVSAFGVEFADALEALPVGEWSAPIDSLQGRHLVRVIERHEPEVAPFEQLEDYLRQDWQLRTLRDLQQRRIDELRAGYRIEVIE